MNSELSMLNDHSDSNLRQRPIKQLNDVSPQASAHPVASVVKSFDVFPKISDDALAAGSASGALISLVTFVLIVWLVVGELKSIFLENDWKHKFVVDSDYQSEMDFFIDLAVAIPCDSVGGDVTDATDLPVPSIGKLKYDRVDFKMEPRARTRWEILRTVIDNTEHKGGVNELADFVWITDSALKAFHATDQKLEQPVRMNHEGCRIHGDLRVHKVAGNFHLVPGKTLPIIGGGHAHVQPLFGVLETNFSHRIEQIRFGNRVPHLVSPLDFTERVTSSDKTLFQYYLKLVPTVVHYPDGSSVSSYQMSVTQHIRNISHEHGSHGMPGIFFKYDFSPVGVHMHPRYVISFRWLIVRLCALIGGIFATSRLLNFLISTILNCLYRRISSKTDGIIVGRLNDL